MSFQMLMSLEELETLEALVSSIIDNTVGSQRKNFCQVIDYDVQVLGDIVDLYILVIVVVLYAIICVNVTHCVCVWIWSISVIVWMYYDIYIFSMIDILRWWCFAQEKKTTWKKGQKRKKKEKERRKRNERVWSVIHCLSICGIDTSVWTEYMNNCRLCILREITPCIALH